MVINCLVILKVLQVQWYRWFSDSWIEQGGHILGGSQYIWATFLKPFKNTNYNGEMTAITYNNGYAYDGNIGVKETTRMGLITTGYSYDKDWIAFGY